MPRRVLVYLALATVLVTSGCLSTLPLTANDADDPLAGASNKTATGPGDGDTIQNRTRENVDDGAGNASRTHPLTLPQNVTLEGAEVLERTNRSVAFEWNASVATGQSEHVAVQPHPAVTTKLHLPPGRWLLVNATLGYPNEGPVYTDLDMNILQDEMGLCAANEACQLRPSPLTDWATWTVRVEGEQQGSHPDSEVPFTVRLKVQAMTGPWGDVEDPPQMEGWPSLEDARIRPGVKIQTPVGGCTANFVFQSPDNSTLYVGTAAHCFGGGPEGVMVRVGGIPNAARLAYCSWGHIGESTSPGCTFALDASAWRMHHNDFALVEVRPDLRHLVHPALRYWGGPTGLAGNVSESDRVLAYGNSSGRDFSAQDAPDLADPMRGYVTGSTGTWVTFVDLLPSGIPGDSGSALLTATGEALGVLKDATCLWATEDQRADGATMISVGNLSPALDFMEGNTDLEVELATWPLLQEPVFPASPVDPAPGPTSCAEGP